MEKTLSANAYLATMISLASSAFGMVAVLGWNEAIKELFNQLLPGAKYYFAIRVDGVETHTTIWAHGADERTYPPQADIPARDCR